MSARRCDHGCSDEFFCTVDDDFVSEHIRILLVNNN